MKGRTLVSEEIEVALEQKTQYQSSGEIIARLNLWLESSKKKKFGTLSK